MDRHVSSIHGGSRSTGESCTDAGDSAPPSAIADGVAGVAAAGEAGTSTRAVDSVVR